MDELYTIREVADKLKISVSSLYRYVETNTINCTRIGSNIRFSRQNISDFLAGIKPERRESIGVVKEAPFADATAANHIETPGIFDNWG